MPSAAAIDPLPHRHTLTRRERTGSLKDIMTGARLVLEEIRDVKRDPHPILERMDRRRSDERFERLQQKSRENLEETREDRRQFNRILESVKE